MSRLLQSLEKCTWSSWLSSCSKWAIGLMKICDLSWWYECQNLSPYENVWTHSQGGLQLYTCIDVLYKLCFILSFQMWRVVCFMLNCNKLVLFFNYQVPVYFYCMNDKVGTCTLICKSSASPHQATLTDMKTGLFDLGWDIWINVHYNWINIFTG